MPAQPKRYEIDHRTAKLIVGLIALFLAAVTSYLTRGTIASISESYHIDEWARNYFVGCLYAIAAFLLAYNGQTTGEMIASKIAALAAFCVAMFPCKCGRFDEIIPSAHGVAAAAMFLVLAFLCWKFLQRALAKGHREAKRRAWIYGSCAAVIVVSIVVLAIDNFTKEALSRGIPRLVFWGECAGLVSFGIAWLTASRVFPGLASSQERFAPWRDANPSD